MKNKINDYNYEIQNYEYNEYRANVNIFNITLIGISFSILGYWIYLFNKYEIDDKYKSEEKDFNDIMEKYNPVLAACIVDERQIISNDIVAVLLTLVNKKVIFMSSYKDINDKYSYIFEKNEKYNKIDDLSELEKYIFNMFFKSQNKFELTEKIKELSDRLLMKTNVRKINNIVKRDLKKIGIGEKKVPNKILNINNILFIFILAISFVNIAFNVNLNHMETYGEAIEIELGEIFGYVFHVLPIFLFLFLTIAVKYLINGLGFLNKITHRFIKNQYLIILSSYIIFSFINIILSIIIFEELYIILNIILFLISVLVILTDDLMRSNPYYLIRDYAVLRALKDSLENGSLLNEKDLKDVVLWEKYLTYAITFNITIVKKYLKHVPNIQIDIGELNMINKSIGDVYDNLYKINSGENNYNL